MNKKFSSLITAAVIGISSMTGAFTALESDEFTVAAATAYPVQEFRLGMADTDNNVTTDGSSLVPAVEAGTSNEKWSLNYISDGVYEIVSSADGKILTANGTGVSLAADTNAANQRWKIEGVQKDFEGFDLYYKITSNADSTKALT